MRVERFTAAVGQEGECAAMIRGLVPAAGDVAADVAAIVAGVRVGGDAALEEYVRTLDAIGDASIAVSAGELSAALDALDPDVRHGLEVAIANVGAVAAASLAKDTEVRLPEGHTVTLRQVPVRRAAIYVPGGRAPYPSTVVMGAVTARAAGVDEVVVCAPGAHPVILAACALCGVDRVHRMGGAHAVAALAYGTGSIERVDVIAGPGNLYVQEAKRLVSGDVGIDGFFGPSDVLVVADGFADPALVAADMRAQAEHGDGTVAVLASDDDALLDAVAAELGDAAETGAIAAVVKVADPVAGIAFADAFAAEHLELMGPGPEALLDDVRTSGCVFVGAESATAFGDYVAGSNHSLPTGGAARFASALSPKVFRRQVSVVRIGAAAGALAHAAGPVARARGIHRARAFDGDAEGSRAMTTRAAEIVRATKETDVTLRLGVDGTGEGQRETGVGFLDHMLDLVARHGRMDLAVAVSGDLQTGAHHTVEDTGIVFGQALDQALGDRSGITRYGHAVVPMDEARASCSIDISGRPYVRFDADLPPGATGTFDHELTEEFFRAVSNNAKLTLHVNVEAGTNAHHMIEAAFKAFARALRQAVSIDPDETGVPSTKGTLTG